MPRSSTATGTGVPENAAVSESSVFESNKKARQTRNTTKVAAKYLPMVLLSDIALTQQSRVPFSKVAPTTATVPKEETSITRRNAERTCKSDINYASSSPDEDEAGPSVPVPISTVTRVNVNKPSARISSGRSRNRNNKRRLRSPEPEPDRCQFCDKPFKDIESAKTHESSCMQNKDSSTSTLQEENKQENFMSFLGMRHKDDLPAPRKVYQIPVPKADAVPPAAAAQEAIPVNERKARSIRLAAATFFRKNVAVPISSQRGMQEILKNDAGLCVNPAELVAQYEKDCPTRNCKSRFNLKESKKVWPVSTSKKTMFKKDEYIHEYSFTRKESIQKLTESAIGLPLRYMRKLNRMRNARLNLTRLSPRAIAKTVSCPTYTFMNRGRRVTLRKCSVKLMDLKCTVEGQELLSKSKLPRTSTATAEMSFPVSTQTSSKENKKRARRLTLYSA